MSSRRLMPGHFAVAVAEFAPGTSALGQSSQQLHLKMIGSALHPPAREKRYVYRTMFTLYEGHECREALLRCFGNDTCTMPNSLNGIGDEVIGSVIHIALPHLRAISSMIRMNASRAVGYDRPNSR